MLLGGEVREMALGLGLSYMVEEKYNGTDHSDPNADKKVHFINNLCSMSKPLIKLVPCLINYRYYYRKYSKNYLYII